MRNLLLGAVCLLGGVSTAQAQFYVRPQTNPLGRPTVSPYVTLGRGFGQPGLNYFGLVRPQQQLQGSLQQLREQQQLAGANLDPNSPSPTTGHGTRFFNYSHYFMNQGGMSAAQLPARVPPANALQAYAPSAGIFGGIRAGTPLARPNTGAPAPRGR